MRRVLLLDLDDTLMVDEAAAADAFDAAARFAATRCGVDAELLARGARARARELWCESPTHDYCARIGISSWEGLWCRFEGDGADVRDLREWSPVYRREAWRLALADQGIDDVGLAEELGEQFDAERRSRHQVFSDVAGALDLLGETHSLALVTNGAACLQREKLAASGLGDYFEAVVVSADIGVAKPHPSVFEHVLSELGAGSDRAVMVGDSLAKDVDGALGAGLRAVWVNRSGSAAVPANRLDVAEISTLSELPGVLAEMG